MNGYVTVRGTLAANGGGGAVFDGSGSGQNGQASLDPAQGSVPTAGDGSAADVLTGTNGAVTAGDVNSAGGGGGGAGRIRINAASEGATIEAGAVVTPGVTTECVTVGTLGG